MKTLIIIILLALLIPTAPYAIMATAAPPDQAVGSVKVLKSIPAVSLDNRVSLMLTVLNNGTVPVFDLEMDEYMNSKLQTQGAITITQPSGQSQVPMSSGGLASTVQVIIDPPSPNTLLPGEKLTITYTQLAASPGDFQIPTTLVWFSYKYGASTIRLSIYSNGLMVHIPNEFEKATIQIYPYVLSITTFTSTITILLWARNKLAKTRR